MKKFHFRLQTLVRLREQARDERRSQLAQACEAHQILLRRSSEIVREISELRQHVARDAERGKVNVHRLLDSHRHEAMLRAEQMQIAKQNKQLAEEIERRRYGLVEADREVRVLEKLRERQRAEHDRELVVQERKAMDEIAVQRAGRVLCR